MTGILSVKHVPNLAAGSNRAAFFQRWPMSKAVNYDGGKVAVPDGYDVMRNDGFLFATSAQPDKPMLVYDRDAKEWKPQAAPQGKA